MATIYTCFDGDNDIHNYRLMQAWHKNEKFDFTFVNAHDITQARDSSSEETIKKSLRTRLNASDVLVVLIGESTKNLFRYVRWEIEVAVEKEIPMIAVNLNGKRKMDDTLCPALLKNNLAVHVSFSPKILNYAIKNWPVNHKSYNSQGKSGAYIYNDSVYTNLGL